MAKDNIPFHTLSFPATIMGSNEPWKLVDYVKGFNWLLYEGGKFSTSQKRGVFMDQALKTLPSDYWRWWLLANAPENSDTDFTWESFQNGINKDLSDVLGNFVSRITKFCASKFGNTIPGGSDYSKSELELIEILSEKVSTYSKHMNAIEVRKAAAELRSIWSAGNEYLQLAAPWSEFKLNSNRAACIVRFSFNLIALYANISRPFIPITSEKIDACLRLKDNDSWPPHLSVFLRNLKADHEFCVPDNLFEKLSDEKMTMLKANFAGMETN